MLSPPDFLTNAGVPELPAPPSLPSFSLPSPGSRHHWLVWTGLFLCGAVVLLLIPVLYGLTKAGLAARHLQSDAALVQSDVRQMDFGAAGRDLMQVEQDLTDARQGLDTAAFLSLVPFVTHQRDLLLQSLRVADEAMQGVRGLITVAQALKEARQSVSGLPKGISIAPTKAFQDLSPDQKRALLARVADALPTIRAAREKVAIAFALWQHVPQDELAGPIRQALQPLADGLPKLKTDLDGALAIAEIGLPLAGYPKEKTYLVLLQNADELRPTGGFIGTVGVLRVDAGDIKLFQFQDVYAIDGLAASTWKDAPPDPMIKYLGIKAWFLRDRNWSPDFPTSAEDVVKTYARETGSVSGLDGVIAFEPGFFRRVLQITGPLTVDGQTFRADDFFTTLEYDVEQKFLGDGTPVRQRKDVVARVGQALFDRLTTTPSAEWPPLFGALTDALDHKDAMVYARDGTVESFVDAHGWSGRTASSERRDYLQVVDANLAALKTDGVMDKQIRYALDFTAASGPVATVTLTYRNDAPRFDWRHTRYRDYVRVYVPEGSELVSSDGAMQNDKHLTGGKIVPGPVDVMRDLGKTVFGAFWAIEPGETRQLTFIYRPSSFPDPYTLFVQKQPGSNTRLTVDVLFGKKIQSADPPEDVSERGDERYRIKDWALEKDQEFIVR